jgi:hypothetical protein
MGLERIGIHHERTLEFEGCLGISTEMVKGHSVRRVRFRECRVELERLDARVVDIRDARAVMVGAVKKKGAVRQAGIGPRISGVDLDGLPEHALREENMGYRV